MKESTKSRARRESEGYFTKYLVGRGIDIGCGDDPVTEDCERWDKAQGDAQTLPGIAPASFDWVYSSHCLEHLIDPWGAVRRWCDVLKPGGYLLFAVPDEDLYEQGCWPSRFNQDHKWTFTTINKSKSWSPVSINVDKFVAGITDCRVIWVRLCDSGYDHSDEIYDRTLGDAEAQIEALLQKLP
jgi:SAM-dependent methyltransferase